MSSEAPVKQGTARVVGLQERRLGRNVIRTYRATVDIGELAPNEEQPRIGPKEDEELQRQIEANEGVFEPLLVEPHPDSEGKFRIIDGHRRWANSSILVEQGKEQFRGIPVEVTDRTLSTEDRLRVWIYIHRQRKEWDSREKAMVAYRLVDLVGRASAASILGATVRELDKLVDIYELSERFTNLAEPAAAITWARELQGISKKLLSPRVVDAVINKVNQKRITNSKELRKLRKILRDPVAKDHFLDRDGDIDSSMLRIAPPPDKRSPGVSGELESLVRSLESVPWTQLEELKGDQEALQRIDEGRHCSLVFEPLCLRDARRGQGDRQCTRK